MEYLLKNIFIINNSMNNDRDKDKIRRALQRFDLIPSKRKTKKEQNRYNKIGTFIDTAKCANSLLILKLCIKLIEDKNTICEKVCEDLDPKYVEIFNIYNNEEPCSNEEIIIDLYKKLVESREDRKTAYNEKYLQNKESEKQIEELKSKISSLQSEVVGLKTKLEHEHNKRMELISKYDSDSEESSTEETPEPLPVVHYDTSASATDEEDSDAEIDWKRLQQKQELEFQKHNINPYK